MAMAASSHFVAGRIDAFWRASDAGQVLDAGRHGVLLKKTCQHCTMELLSKSVYSLASVLYVKNKILKYMLARKVCLAYYSFRFVSHGVARSMG
jgi:hypothetical protein